MLLNFVSLGESHAIRDWVFNNSLSHKRPQIFSFLRPAINIKYHTPQRLESHVLFCVCFHLRTNEIKTNILVM
jgi:hypothetical protein